MSLLGLPPSITALVASFLPSPLSSYAAISRDWQETIETLTFRHVHINKPSRIEAFGNVFVGTRRRWLNRLEVVALLPGYDSEACKRIETPEEQEQNNEAFTATVKNILEILRGWETDGNGATRAGGITLDLSAHSPSDMSGQKTLQAQDAKQRAVNEGRDIHDARYTASFLHFKADGQDLPTVKAVTGLYVDGQTPRHISGSTVTRLAACFPRLTNLRAKVWDREAKSLDLRLKERNEFAISLHLLPPTLRTFSLTCFNWPPQNEQYLPPSLLDSQHGDIDPLSTAIHAVSLNLVKLDLQDIVFDPTCLFWPTSSEMTKPLWPNLRSVTITYSPVTTSGEWIIERNPDPESPDPESESVDEEGEEEEEEEEEEEDLSLYLSVPQLPAPYDWPPKSFRSMVNPDIMDSFYLSVGHAIAQMPKLELMMLSQAAGRSEYPHMLFFESRVSGRLNLSGRGMAKATWYSDPVYVPSDEVIAVWERSVDDIGGVLEVDFMEANDF